jgi:phage N-6-adenine-methyltransferase
MQLPLFESQFAPSRNGKAREERHPANLLSYDSARNHWRTPQEIIDQALKVLGAVDLDPCCTNKANPAVPARMYYDMEDHSLSQTWSGRIFLNPPYGRQITHWIDKLCYEYEDGGVTAAIALVPARTDTEWWQKLSNYPYCAIRGRVKFVREDGKKSQPPYPSAVVYMGPFLTRFDEAFSKLGTIYMPYNMTTGNG